MFSAHDAERTDKDVLLPDNSCDNTGFPVVLSDQPPKKATRDPPSLLNAVRQQRPLSLTVLTRPLNSRPVKSRQQKHHEQSQRYVDIYFSTVL